MVLEMQKEKSDIQIKKDIGKKIRICRIDKDLSVRQLAKQMNVRPRIVWSWESGRTSPNIVRVLKLKELIGLEI